MQTLTSYVCAACVRTLTLTNYRKKKLNNEIKQHIQTHDIIIDSLSRNAQNNQDRRKVFINRYPE